MEDHVRKNPLFADKPVGYFEINAASTAAPKSPFTGEPMVRAKCRDFEVWCDLKSRVVFPVTEGN